MTQRTTATPPDIERRVRSFLATEAPGVAPESLHRRVSAIRPRHRSPASAVLEAVRDTADRLVAARTRRTSQTTVSGSRASPARRATIGLAISLLLLLAAALVVVAPGLVGSRPSSETAGTETPWTFHLKGARCGDGGSAEPVDSSPLPAAGSPRIQVPGNGLLSAGATLIDPETGQVVATAAVALGSGTSAILRDLHLDRWSPDGARVAARIWDDEDCRATYVISSDGRRITNVATELVSAKAWSPDGRWLAFGVRLPDDDWAIDVAAIADDGSIDERRRLVVEPGWIEMLDWGPDGTLAWMNSGADRANAHLGLLDPGSASPRTFDLGSAFLYSPRWTRDGRVLAAVGHEDAGGTRLYVVTPADGSVRALELAIEPVGGKYTDEVPTDSSGRILFPGRTDGTGESDVYSVELDGSDLRNLTAFPTDGADTVTAGVVLSPDETQVAFYRDGLWLMDADGSRDPFPVLGYPHPRVNGGVAWQPSPESAEHEGDG